MTTKKVLFLCGSPRRQQSASLHTARYLVQFLDYDYEFVDVAGAKLSTDPAEAEPTFSKIVEKMQAADAVVWTFGAWMLYMPVQIQYLLDKLFTQGYDFTDKIAAAVMTSVRVHDDYILDRVHFVSEQLGFGYIGDVSAVSNPSLGLMDDEEATEDSCHVLAGQINRALTDGYIPARHYPLVERNYLLPTYRGHGFAVDGSPMPKTGDKTILVITGNRLAEDPANTSVVESIRRYSKNNVEVVELQDRKVGPCPGCYLCDFNEDGACVIKDDYEALKQRMHQVDGIVYIGTCASGMVDVQLKAFIDRTWGIAHRPSLKGKYGFVVATGGGPLEVNAAWYLRSLLGKTGTRCIAALTQSAADHASFATTLRRTVEDLDQALDERWQIADRSSVRAITLTFRDLIAANGMLLRADYRFHRENKMFDYPSCGGANALLRVLFKNKKLERWLTATRQQKFAKAREKRLAAYLRRYRLGEGKEISSFCPTRI